MLVTTTTPNPALKRVAAKPLATTSAPSSPAVVRAPQVKAPATGAIETVSRVFSAGCGAVGGGMLGAGMGWCAWFFTQGALSTNWMGIGLLVGAVAFGALGWFNGGTWGKAIEDTLGWNDKK